MLCPHRTGEVKLVHSGTCIHVPECPLPRRLFQNKKQTEKICINHVMLAITKAPAWTFSLTSQSWTEPRSLSSHSCSQFNPTTVISNTFLKVLSSVFYFTLWKIESFSKQTFLLGKTVSIENIKCDTPPSLTLLPFLLPRVTERSTAPQPHLKSDSMTAICGTSDRDRDTNTRFNQEDDIGRHSSSGIFGRGLFAVITSSADNLVHRGATMTHKGSANHWLLSH